MSFTRAVVAFLSVLSVSAVAADASAQATNVALAGTASQSSLSSAGLPERAIDGNTDGSYPNGSVTHTASTANPWWRVDLAQIELIHEIRIWNRSDCCATRLTNFKLEVFLASAPIVTRVHPGTIPAGGFMSFELGVGVAADAVRIELLGTNPLSLAEVEVLRFDRPVMNLARLGVASQSTTRAAGGEASRAIDGVRDGIFTHNSVTHTNDQAPSWWEVALPWPETVDAIHIFNRADCCGLRLSNFRVSVFLGPVEIYGMDYFLTTGSVGQGQSLEVNVPAGTRGDRVRVELKGLNRQGNNILSLAEVEVLRYGASLTPDVLEVKFQIGNQQNLALDAGRGFGGQLYLLLGSFSGTFPGVTLSGVNTPLNIDPYFLWTLENANFPPLANSRGNLDALGRATAVFTIPAGVPNLVGLRLDHAFAVVGTTKIIDAASNPAALKIVQ